MELPLTSCTECGATVQGEEKLCPRCHRPKWYTLRKVSVCLLIVVMLAALIKLIATYGDRTLALWFG